MLFLDLTVNNKKARFIIDTGASVSLVDYEQAEDYGFQYFKNRNVGKINGIGGVTDLRMVTKLKVAAFGCESKFIPFYGSNLKYLNDHLASQYTKVLGVLGSDFLARSGAVIDYQQRKLILTH